MGYSVPSHLDCTISVTYRTPPKEKKTEKTIYRNRMDKEQIQT
jgi:hypothetical protein